MRMGMCYNIPNTRGNIFTSLTMFTLFFKRFINIFTGTQIVKYNDIFNEFPTGNAITRRYGSKSRIHVYPL